MRQENEGELKQEGVENQRKAGLNQHSIFLLTITRNKGQRNEQVLWSRLYTSRKKVYKKMIEGVFYTYRKPPAYETLCRYLKEYNGFVDFDEEYYWEVKVKEIF